MVALQRTVGNRATAALLAGGATVQRVKRLAAHQTTLPSAEEQRDQGMFTAHDVDPAPPADMEAPLSWGKSAVVDPSLLSSNDETVVIQDTTREPQEFYATDGVLAASTKALADHKSLVGLEIGGAQLELGGKSLKKARAKSRVIPVADGMGKELAAIATSICIDVASIVMGLKTNPKEHQVVLGPASSGTKGAPITSTGTESAQVNQLAALLGKGGTPGVEEATAAMGSGAKAPEDTASSYGARAKEAGFPKAAEALGVNEFAEPEVGEAFATYSIKSEGDAKAQAVAKLESGHVWGYHYAAVVAESEDKKDKVTLENYNRSSDIYKAYGQAIIADLGETVRPKVEAFLGDRPNPAKLGAFYAQVKKLAGQEATQVADKIRDKVLAADQEAWNQWYFALFGTVAAERDPGALTGSTFHARAAATGYFTNPLTVRVRAPDTASYNDSGIYRELIGAIEWTPSDVSFDIRAYAVQQAGRQEWVANVKKAAESGGTTSAQATTRQALEDLRLRQCKAYWSHYAAKASPLLGAKNVPAEPTSADAYPAELKKLATKCREAKAKSYGVGLWWSGFNWSGDAATTLADDIDAAATHLTTQAVPYYQRYLA